MTIEIQPVTSGMIEGIGHHPETSTLAVKFKGSSGTYHYAGVSADDHAALIGADSIGKHFAANIKGKYDFKKVEG